MPKETILIIEDERNITELLHYNLSQAGYRVLTAASGQVGLEKAIKQKPSLILLDLMLPELDGIEVCKILKQNPATASIPILMLTAKSEVEQKILGLELGAEDYITKPFSPREVAARIKAVLRGLRRKSQDKILKAGDLEMDTGKYAVTLKGKPLELTSKEYHLLRLLMAAEGRALARDFIRQDVWGYSGPEIESGSLDVHMSSLRSKLKSESRRIVTVKGMGYRFES